MTTAAELDAALAEQIRAIVARHYPGLAAVGLLVRELAAFTSGYTATAIEETCRTPASQMGPGRRRGPRARPPDPSPANRRGTR